MALSGYNRGRFGAPLWLVLYCAGIWTGCIHDPGRPEKTEVRFHANRPEAFDFALHGRKIEQVIAREIAQARESVSMAVFNFESPVIREALFRAQARGVQVRVVGDIDESATAGYRSLEGLSVTLGNAGGIQHNKFVVIDKEMIITGTGNFSPSGFMRNNNHFMMFRDPGLAARYQAEFDQMHVGFFARAKSPQKTETRVHSPVQVYFSPQEGEEAMARLIQLVRQARHSIHYMIFAFTHDELASELIRAAQRGVRVQGIHDSNFVRGISQEAPRLYRVAMENGRLEVRVEGNANVQPGSSHGGKMHCKTLIIDAHSPEGVLATGSFNWSENAVNNNDENLLIAHDPALAKSALAQWREAWSYARSLKEKLPGKQGDTAAAGEVVISEVAWAANYRSGPYSEPSEKDDFVEIFNRTDRVIDLTHWTLGWREQGVEKHYPIPGEHNGGGIAGVSIGPGERRVFHAGGPSTFAERLSSELSIKLSSTKNFFLTRDEPEVSLYDIEMREIDTTGALYGRAPGGVDPDRRISRSMERVIPDEVPLQALPPFWQPAQEPCLACDPVGSLYATPGAPRRYRFSPELLDATPLPSQMGERRVKVRLSGEVCLDPGAYQLRGPGAVQLTRLEQKGDELLVAYRLDQPPRPDDLFSLHATEMPVTEATALYQGAGFWLRGGPTGLYRSATLDSPSTRLVVLSPEERVHQISAFGNLIYVATDQGLAVSVDGATFSLLLGGLSVHEVDVAGTSIAAATGDGLYLSTDSGANFTRISSGFFEEVALTSGHLLAHRSGSYGGLYRYRRNPPYSPEYLESFPAPLSLEHEGEEVSLLAGGVLHRSLNGGASFVAQTLSSLPDAMHSLFRLATGELLLVGPEGALVYSQGAILYQQSFAPGQAFKVNATSGRTLATTGGAYLFTGSGFSSLPLPGCASLPRGRVRWNDAPEILQARLGLSQISFGRGSTLAWVELEVLASGRIGGFVLKSSSDEIMENLAAFGDIYLEAPSQVRVLLESGPKAGNDGLGPVKGLFYSPAPRPSTSDGVVLLFLNDQPVDFLYYSNRDGNIVSSMMNGVLRRFYGLREEFPGLGYPSQYAIDGYNDDLLQGEGVDISRRKTGDLLIKEDGRWILR